MFSIPLSTIFEWVTWLVAGVGVTGAIVTIAAVVFLGPAAVSAILQPIWSKFLACGKCILATVVFFACLGSFWVGHHDAVKQCREAEKSSVIEAQQADIEAARLAKENAIKRANQIESEANDQHKRDLDFIEKLKAQPKSCGFVP